MRTLPPAFVSHGIPSANAPFRLTIDTEGPSRRAAFALEAQIFGARYGVAYPAHVAEFAPYEDNSVFAVVTDADDEVAGMMRWIVPGPAGLKTLNEAAQPPWQLDSARAAAAVGIDPDQSLDVASLAVRPRLGGRRAEVTAALYHALAVAVTENRVRTLLMTVDERVRTVLEAHGMYGRALPGAVPMPFCGSPASTPVYGHCAEMRRMQRQLNPEGFRLIALGLGIDVALPPRSDFRMAAFGRFHRIPASAPRRRSGDAQRASIARISATPHVHEAYHRPTSVAGMGFAT
jgi:hypothetical protein